MSERRNPDDDGPERRPTEAPESSAGTSERPRPPVALTIAGSDSGGGAGIQADLKTFHAFGVFGTTAITAVTAQNTLGVQGVRALDPEFVLAQITAVCADLEPAACKTGMLANAGILRAVARGIQKCGVPHFVLDPVTVATSGDMLLEPEAVSVLVGELLPLASIVTPNRPEAQMLVGREIETLADVREAARALVDRGAGAALVKGGHLTWSGLEKRAEAAPPEVVDLFWDGQNERVWAGPRLNTPHTHGTGCTLSAAVTAGLALGRSLVDSVDAAIAFTRAAIARAPGLGSGHGPLDHWVPAGGRGESYD